MAMVVKGRLEVLCLKKQWGAWVENLGVALSAALAQTRLCAHVVCMPGGNYMLPYISNRQVLGKGNCLHVLFVCLLSGGISMASL